MMPCRTLRAFFLVAAAAVSAAAQTPVDGLTMPRRAASVGVLYAHDTWDEYWEGTLKRRNGNIGTITTRSVAVVAGYGITERLSAMAALPYVWTHASQGVLSDMRGIQDLTIAAKYRLFTTQPAGGGALSAFVAGSVAAPMSKYTPDFFPLSIGIGDGRASGRLMLDYQSESAWFANASAAYTWCGKVTLNRNSYYTDGQLFMTNEVAIPNVVESSLTAGYRRGRLRLPVSVVQHHTLGGGDIRRQDMPFVSNRMDFVRMDAALLYALPVPSNVSIQIGAAHVLNGRNVGQSTTFTSGFFYAFHQ